MTNDKTDNDDRRDYIVSGNKNPEEMETPATPQRVTWGQSVTSVSH